MTMLEKSEKRARPRRAGVPGEIPGARIQNPKTKNIVSAKSQEVKRCRQRTMKRDLQEKTS